MDNVNVYVLKLNCASMPIEIINLKDALRLWAKDKVEVVETYTNKIIKSNYSIDYDDWASVMNVPAVVRLKQAFSVKKNFKVYMPFTRRNVWERDNHCCQYCGTKLSLAQLTYDHIIPQSMGGKTNWTNIVSCCSVCNNHKGHKLLTECGLKLKRQPYAPITANSFYEGVMKRMRKIKWITSIDEWRDYIYWNVELEHDE